jgi:predicted aspartyl protease
MGAPIQWGALATSHIYVDVVLRGSRGEVLLKNVIVDTGATYTILDKKTADEVGAWRIPFEIHLELGDGRIVKASMYAIIVTLEGRTAPTLTACFEGVESVIGVRTLEDLGLRVDPVSGKLEPVRPSNLAYFY